MSAYAIGKDIKSYCGKCKLTLYHTVTVMVGEQVKKVQCNTCKSTHALKDAPGKATKRKSTTTRKRAPSVPMSDLWKQALEESTKDAVPYSIKGSFEEGDIVDHKKFGQGIIQKCLDNDKIEIMFQNEIKTLVHRK